MNWPIVLAFVTLVIVGQISILWGRLEQAASDLRHIREARAHCDRMIVSYRCDARASAALNAHAASLIAAAELEPAVIVFSSLRVTTPQDDYS